MKIEAFQTLDALLRRGTMAAAAAEMNITASAVSLQVKQLEAYLGQPLFDRSGLQVRPVPLAYEVAAAMQLSLDRLETLRRRPTVVVEGTLRLGVIDSMQPQVLPGLLHLLRERYPLLEVRPVRGKRLEQLAAVSSGKLDAALVLQPAGGGSARLSSRPLQQRQLVLLAPPDDTSETLQELFRRYEWIRFDRGTLTGRMATRFVNAHVRDKRGTLEFDGVPVIVAMVSAGLGVALVSVLEPSICLLHPVRVLRPERDEQMVTLSFVTRKADADGRAVGVVRDTMAEVLARLLRQPDVGHILNPVESVRMERDRRPRHRPGQE